MTALDGGAAAQLAAEPKAAAAAGEASRWLVRLCAAAFALGLAWRLVGWHRVFWIDETFTGAIALQPGFAGLVRDCLHELGGPVYYAFAWAWAKPFGVGNVALRLPSFLCSLAAPALILWRGHPDRHVRLVWSALAVLLYMLVYYATEARSYCLMFLLAAGQAIVLGRMIRRPGLRPAAAWAALSALLVLTHYFTAPLVALQGLGYLLLGGRRALRTWPAALLFLPVAAWMAVHLPLLLRFADPRVAWQQLLRPHDLPGIAGDVFGDGLAWIMMPVCLAAAATVAVDCGRAVRARRPSPYAPADLVAFAASLGAAALLLAYGVLRPSFTPRYLVPLLPGLLLGLAAWAVRLERRWPALPVALVGLFLAGGLVEAVVAATRPSRDIRTSLAWQRAADGLMAARVRRVAFFWDEVQATVPAPDLLARTGGFFFDRAGAGVRTIAVVLAGRGDDPDPNLALPAILDAARRDGARDAFLWIYTIHNGQRTQQSRHPVDYPLLARRFACRDYARDGETVVLACVRRDGAPTG